jgi:excisionase family DNA binding protein
LLRPVPNLLPLCLCWQASRGRALARVRVGLSIGSYLTGAERGRVSFSFLGFVVLWKFVEEWQGMARKAKNPDYLTAKEVADRCRVTRRTVYNWIKDGVLGADRAGKVWLVTEADLAAFLKRPRLDLESSQVPSAKRAAKSGAGRTSSPGEVPQQQQAQKPAQPVAVPAGFHLGEEVSGVRDYDMVHNRLDDYPEMGDQEAPPVPRPSLPAARLSGKKKKPGGRKR